MHIANPIYDVVFKFMMEDEKVAKCFLSAIIGEEVIELDFTSQERTVRRVSTSSKKEKQEEQEICLTICHYDFAAKIATAGGGFKTVLIEVQKAKLISDVMRFRRYLGRNYQNPDNTFGEELRKRARQIYCIFLLGYDIDVPGRPVVQIEPRVTDAATKEVLPDNNEFIQSLHHRSWIVQIEQLKQRRRTDLEKLLSIFDQESITKNHHILNVNEEDFPEAYRFIIRRLRMACESEDIQIEMEMEDDYLKELQDKERFINQQTKLIEEQKEALEEQKRIQEEQKKALEEKDRAIEELKRLLAEKNSKQ